MTSYLLFAGLGFLMYVGVSLAGTAIASFGGAHAGFQICAAPCGEEREYRSQSGVVGGESQAASAGRSLFQQRGCAGCHRADSTGVGPRLDGLFGSPVQDAACGVANVDES